jgi:heme/copper-type cytochrome/quinol oxidase subunit 2
MTIKKEIIKVHKTSYNTRCSNNKKYIGLLVIATAILLFSNFILGFDTNTKLEKSLSGNKANASQVNITKTTIENGVQVIRLTANNNGYTPNEIYVKKDIPVKLIIEGNQLNSCNNGIVVPTLNIEKDLKPGENIIEFTPKDQDIDFSCWMGMIKEVIKVTDNIDSINEPKKF